MHLILRAIQEDAKALDEILESSPMDQLEIKVLGPPVRDRNLIGLGQLDVLVDLLQEDKWVKEHYNTDFNELWDKLINITVKQKSYIWFLVGSKKYHKLGEILNQLQIQRI